MRTTLELAPLFFEDQSWGNPPVRPRKRNPGAIFTANPPGSVEYRASAAFVLLAAVGTQASVAETE